MSDKVSSALDDYRVQVAQTMFSSPVDTSDVEEESDDNVQ
jgi:hypothetical protein